MSTSYRFYSAALSLFTYVPTSLAVAAVVTLTATYWTAFVQWTNLSDRVLFVLTTLFVHESVWADEGRFDPLNLRRWKIVRPKGVPQSPSKEQSWAAFKQITIDHFTIQPLSMLVLYEIMSRTGSVMVGPTPSFWKIFIQIFLAWNIDDFLLYSMHRVAHSKRLYYIHKKHHQFSASTGWASEWMSPIDSFVVNQTPVLVGPIVMGFHFYVWLGWVAVRVIQTNIAHSGYAIPYLWSEVTWNHDDHHSRNVGNYGMPHLDLLFGTINETWLAESEAKSLGSTAKKDS